jgi:hypothetical protein
MLAKKLPIPIRCRLDVLKQLVRREPCWESKRNHGSLGEDCMHDRMELERGPLQLIRSEFRLLQF